MGADLKYVSSTTHRMLFIVQVKLGITRHTKLYGPMFPLRWTTAQMRSTTRSFAQWNLILAHLQQSKFKNKMPWTFFEAEAERFWAYRVAILAAIWIKCVLCSCFDKISCLFKKFGKL